MLDAHIDSSPRSVIVVLIEPDGNVLKQINNQPILVGGGGGGGGGTKVQMVYTISDRWEIMKKLM